jgi:hypothetical protein
MSLLDGWTFDAVLFQKVTPNVNVRTDLRDLGMLEPHASSVFPLLVKSV